MEDPSPTPTTDIVMSSGGGETGEGGELVSNIGSSSGSKDKVRHVDIPAASMEDSAAVPVLRLVKNTTPKGLREVRNVLRWRVPNDHGSAPDVTTKHMTYNANVERPRSAPSASLSDPPEKIQRVNSFNKTSKTTTQKIKANNVHKRHWMYLYDNLHRAVDEMYKTCEQDFSIEQCSNVVHTMELCMEDFKRLAHKIKVQTELMNDETKRNKAIAWDEPYPRSNPSSVAPSPATPPRTPILIPYIEPAMLVDLDDNKFPQLDLPSIPTEHTISPSQLRRSTEAWGVPGEKDKDRDQETDEATTEEESDETRKASEKDKIDEKETKKEHDTDRETETETDTEKKTGGDSTDTDKDNKGDKNENDKGKEKEKEKETQKEVEKENDVPATSTTTTPRDQASDTSSNSDIGVSGNLPWAERLKRSLSHLAPPASSYKKQLVPPKAAVKARKPMPRSVSSEPLKRTLREDKPRKHSKHKSPPLNDVRLRQDEKQAKASKNREQYVNSKKEKVALVLSRVKDVNERQSQKIIQRQLSIEEKQEKAISIHEAHIDQIKRKATAENTKVDEVAYITSQITETRKFIQQKRLEDTEARRQGQLEGKKKKLNIQAAKEEAVVERKKQIEHARMHMQMHNDVLASPTLTTHAHSRKSPSKSPSKSPNKGRSKVDLDLQARRLKRVCKYCNVELLSDEYIATHLTGRKHKQQEMKQKSNPSTPRDETIDEDEIEAPAQEAEGEGEVAVASVDKDSSAYECVLTIPLEPNLPYLTLSSPAKIEAILHDERTQKKRAKKTKLQISQLALSYVDPGVQPPRETPHKSRLVRSVTDLKSLLAKKSFSTMPGVLSDISRVLGSKGGHMEIDLQIFRQLGGIDLLASICGYPESKIPYNVLSECISLLSLACTQASNRLYMIMTGRLVPLIDLLNKKILQTPEASFLPALATLLTLHFWQPAEKGDEIKQQTINYIIQVCLFEKIEQKLAQLQTNIDGDPSACLFIEKTVEFLESITAFLQSNTRDKPIYVESSIAESQIIQVLRKTSIVGILSLLASLMLQGRPARGSNTPPSLPPTTWSVIFSSVKVLNNIAALGFKFLQSYLGDDDHQVELFHLLGHLLWYCSSSMDDSSSQKRQKLLNEIILLAGYYALQNSRTQETFQWGNSPTILQLLCGLPFQYFSDPRYKTILFPTLIAVCFQNSRNVTILQQEMSVDLIVDYIKGERDAKEVPPSSQVPARFLFKNRFPTSHWAEALEYFTPKNPA